MTSVPTTDITFNDTSEFMYRNSATKRGGFEGTITGGSGSTDLAVSGNEDLLKTQEELTDADRVLLRSNIKTLTDCAVAALCTEKTSLSSRNELAWARAIGMFPELQALIDAEITDLKAETEAYICLWETQWARTAGSSHNSLVISMKNKAATELSRRLAGIIAERLGTYKQMETEAISRAFTDGLTATTNLTQLGFTHIGTMYQVLRGSVATSTTERLYSENRDESRREFQASGKFFHDVTDISDNSGDYNGELSSAYSASQSIAGSIPSA